MSRRIAVVLAIAALSCARASTPDRGFGGGAPDKKSSGATAGAAAALGKPIVERIAQRSGSAIALAKIEKQLMAYVVDEDDRRLLTIDVEQQKVVSEVALDGAPAQVITLPKNRVAVTLRDRGRVVVYEGAGVAEDRLKEIAHVDVASEPIGLAMTPDDATLLVTSGWGHALTAIATADHHVRFTKDLGREPRGITASADGKLAYIAHATGNGLSIVDLEADKTPPKVWYLEAESWVPGFRGMPTGPFLRKSSGAFAIAASAWPAGRIFVPHVAVHTSFGQQPEGMFEPEVLTGYGSAEAGAPEVFDIAVIDEASKTPMDFEPRPIAFQPTTASSRIVTNEGGCLLPRAAIADRNNLYVACMDTDKVLELDAAQLHPERAIVRSWKAPRGPMALAVDHDGERLVVWSHLARKLTVFGISEKANQLALSSFAIDAKKPLSTELARGRDLFYSGEARISGDGRACASCHPDGRDDGLVWATPDGPRQTPMLAGRLEGTAPYGWTGSAADVESHVPKTFKRLGGKGLTGDDKVGLLAYVRSIPAPPPRAAKDSNVVARGQAIFASEQAGCSGCHGPGGDLPDGSRHDVKSRANGDVTAKFDTPSLKGVGGSGPWFHDGRYKNLSDLLVKSDGKMGHTKHLSKEDLDALEAYLQTL